MPDYNFYVLAVLDLLGQSRLLEDLTEDFVIKCVTGNRHAELIAKMKPTFGRVKGFREHLRDIVRDLTRPLPLPAELEGVIDPKTFEKYTGASVEVEFMGDSALLKVCLGNQKDKPLPLSSIKNMFEGLSMTTLSMLAGEIPVRGAIELGWGTHIEGSIYGTMLHRAIRLEKEAGYPRIVIGKSLQNYLGSLETYPQGGVNTEEARFIQKTAKQVTALISEDDDGVKVLNYLVRNRYLANAQPFDDGVKKAKEYIERQIRGFGNNGPEELYHRYCRLRRFFQKCGYG